jgi:hypothetical protein
VKEAPGGAAGPDNSGGIWLRNPSVDRLPSLMRHPVFIRIAEALEASGMLT